jgi:hypothetical protein
MSGEVPMELTATVAIHIDEDETNTLAFAQLDLRGDHFEATGRARRNPGDRPMPVVGEELAIARALSHLSVEVMEAAQTKIERFLSE